jgi:hypothetical protein
VSPAAARSTRRGFVLALGASLLLHALTLTLTLPAPGGSDDPAQRAAPALPPLTAVTLLPPHSAGSVPVLPGTPAPVEREPARSAIWVPPEPTIPTAAPEAPPDSSILAQAAPIAPTQPQHSPASSADDLLPPPAAPQQAAPPSAADPAEPVPGTTASAASEPETAIDPMPRPGSIRLPSSGHLEYSVTLGDPPTPLGRATYAWETSEATYRLSLSAETTGLVGLLRRVRVVQTSEGRITPDGLRPDTFSMDRGGPAARNEFARFDWTARQLIFGYPGAIQAAALGAGTQDTLSLILQFAFVPIEEGRRDVALTSGRKLYVQTYEQVGEEVVETPAGAWRAWHLRRVRAQAGDEGYDMWLATDRPFLPVRIRWTDRRGRVTSATLDTVRLARD